jgi:ferredoxin-NADP reductase
LSSIKGYQPIRSLNAGRTNLLGMSVLSRPASATASDIDTTPMDLILTAIVLAARDTHLFTFQEPGGGALPAADPGAHIGLLLPGGLERQYSLVDPGISPRAYVIGVKRDPASRGGSRYMHDELRVGTVVRVLPPRNNFRLVEDAGHVTLVAGGIGITPVYSMLQRLRALGRSWTLHYCCRSRADAAFLAELENLPEVVLFFDDENPGRLPPIDRVVAEAPMGAHLYCCGPAPMLAAFETAAAVCPRDHVHVEYFAQKYEAATAGGFVVELQRSGLQFSIPPGSTILHVLRGAGVEVPSSCEEGVCGACETKVLSGQPDHRDAILSDQERIESATMMICCSGCKSDRLVLDI